ncbi:hypothetical protein LU699_13390 [Luteimonas fraxinea]|uniref:Secreted protein n=1 Tax=Luteimonas fraxinea TaxID=2901869 RepID=A0ABS8UGX0_9GAMM|nr:DUF6607 family protein [Luteimonas fraxinea]MCD9097991.1 hypothetical protein [Luteimonas fraxinea]UHH09280.1 hypothetical protein LU699_13390 [Luteimonas fraxinea]
MTPQATALALAALLASTAAPAATRTPATPPEADRSAILGMQGEYSVRFLFDETVVLAPGYTRKEPKRSGGDEVVIVVEDTPTKIVLQHLLLDVKSGHVIKHWRQDWTFEAPTRWEFASDQTWRQRNVPAELVQGGWTQCVFEVSDAPRYCGSGRWVHGNGASTWTSDAGWRPLPRREYTTREDYNALAAVNRHTIVPGGWTHEQDNHKDVRDASGAVTASIVRETGFNDYVKTDAIDFTPAYDYWKATQDYWARVRARWDVRLSAPDGVHLKTKVDGMALIVPFFEQAQTVQDGGSVSDAQIDAVFAEWVDTPRD